MACPLCCTSVSPSSPKRTSTPLAISGWEVTPYRSCTADSTSRIRLERTKLRRRNPNSGVLSLDP